MKETISSFSYEVTAIPYTLGGSRRLSKEIRFHLDWVRLVRNYTVSILGWIQYYRMDVHEGTKVKDDEFRNGFQKR